MSQLIEVFLELSRTDVTCVQDGIPLFTHKLADKVHKVRSKIDPEEPIKIIFFGGPNRDAWGGVEQVYAQYKDLWPRKSSTKKTLASGFTKVWNEYLHLIAERSWSYRGRVDADILQGQVIDRFDYPRVVGIYASAKPPTAPKFKTIWERL